MAESMDELMQKLSEDPHGDSRGGGYRMKGCGSVNMDKLMEGMAERTDEIIAKHEAERAAAEQRQRNRALRYPDQYERMQQEKNGKV